MMTFLASLLVRAFFIDRKGADGQVAIVVATIVGILLGRPVYRLLFPPSSGGPPEKEKKDEKNEESHSHAA